MQVTGDFDEGLIIRRIPAKTYRTFLADDGQNLITSMRLTSSDLSGKYIVTKDLSMCTLVQFDLRACSIGDTIQEAINKYNAGIKAAPITVTPMTGDER